MNRKVIVTVLRPVVACESEFMGNPRFEMTPGMVGWYWPHLAADRDDGKIGVTVENGPKNRLGISWYVSTTIDNVVPVTNPSLTCIYASLVSPEHMNEAVRLCQKQINDTYVRSIVPLTNPDRFHTTLYDRHGNMWRSDEVLSRTMAIAEGWQMNNFQAAVVFLWQVYRFTTTKPTKPEPTVRQNRRSKYTYVNVYHLDRYYKGPYEGGTWRNEEWCTESYRVKRKAAPRLLRDCQKNCEERNAGTPDIYSVLSEGKYSARIENFSGFGVGPEPFVYE